MRLSTRPAADTDAAFAYAVKKVALGAYVAQTWGWDEAVQQQWHTDAWAKHRPDVIELAGEPIGTLEVISYADHLYVGEFYLIPARQRQGLGSELLLRVLAQADAAQLPVRLQFLRVNPVRSRYERHGFVITGASETHYFAERRPGTLPPRAV
jgi:GNAT superfamily N-acetyltransferase